MKQNLRVTLVSVLILALAVLGVGGASVAIAYNDSLNSSAAVLASGVKSVAGSGGSLGSATAFADNSELPIAVALVAFDDSVNVLHDTDFAFASSYSPGLLKAAVAHAVVIEDAVPYQLRAVITPNNEYVLFGTSLALVRAALDRNILVLILASIIAVGLGGILVFVLARRNSKSMISALSMIADHERETREAMQSFLGDASHELRTPLTVIKGYSELLAKDSGDAETRNRAYARIVEQVNRMDGTIGGLLELAEVGSVSASTFAPVDLAALVSGAAEDLKAMSPTRTVSVTVEPCVVQGSADLLGRLLANAIGNIARHAGQKAAVSISLKVVRRSAVLVIEDGGKGLPDEAYAGGVQAFKRFDPSRSRSTGGTGLGMSIMNSIVEAHAGKFGISRSSLSGLRLDIELPLNPSTVK